MEEKLHNSEIEANTQERGADPRTEFREYVELGAYKSLSRNEFFQNLEPDEQFDAMHSTLENCLANRDRRFYRLVATRPDLAAAYRDQEIKPLRSAMDALDEIALVSGKEMALQQNPLTAQPEELEEAA